MAGEALNGEEAIVAEVLAMLAFLSIVAVLLLGPLILSIIALIRTRRIGALERRIEQLNALVRQLAVHAPGGVAGPEPATSEPSAAILEPEPTRNRPVAGRLRKWSVDREPIDWEGLIGQRALGWVAVVVLVFAAAFFLRYAIENRWIGPLGRVALAAVAGMALVLGGQHYHQRGWRVFAPMLTGGGLVVFYLATFAAFGFYHLLPRQAAAVFLLVIVVESMVLAVLYDRMALGLVAVLGGLLTPVLLHTEHDPYQALFTYLVVLDVGVVLLALWREWPAIATTGLLGTHLLFWSWYAENYHPEKRPAALVLLIAVFLLFLGHGLIGQVARRRPAGWEDLGRWLANGFLAFLAVYVLLRPDYDAWMGTLALATAALYAALARLMLATRPQDDRLFLATLAMAVGFVALAFPIQADAPWIALSWAVEAAALWWLGLRVQSPTLKVFATVLAVMAVTRLVFIDTPSETRPPFLPIINRYALPALGVCACLLGALATTRRWQVGLANVERKLLIAAEIGGILLLGYVLSVDLYGYCDARAAVGGTERILWERIGETTLSVLWAFYATAVLAVGFVRDRPWLRWTALGWYGLTLGKVFLVDLAGLDELYRILAFLVLAIALGLAARAYHGLRPSRRTGFVGGRRS